MRDETELDRGKREAKKRKKLNRGSHPRKGAPGKGAFRVADIKVRVARVSAPRTMHGRYSSFYNPSQGIAQAIADSLNPDKVRQETPERGTEQRPEPFTGIQVAVVRRIKEFDTGLLQYLLPTGWKFNVFPSQILEEGPGYVRVPTHVVKRSWVLRVASRWGKAKALNKEAAKFQLMERRAKR